MPTIFRIEISADAETDIADLFHYIAQDSPEKAMAFVRSLKKQIASLRLAPERCPKVPENQILGTSYRHLLYGSYRAIFRISGSHVIVLRVVHSARLLDTTLFLH